MSETTGSAGASELVVHVPRWNTAALELVCGIANAGGGCLLIPSSRKDYSSEQRMKRSFELIPNAILEETGLQCSLTPVMDGNEFFLEVEIPAATEPVGIGGTYWLYVNGRNERRTSEEVFRSWHDEGSTAWELKTLPYVDYNDLSTDALLDVAAIPLTAFKDTGGNLTETIKARLDHLGLSHPRTKKLINAGGLLLCLNPARFIPGASVRIVSFNADGSPTGEQDEVVGPLGYQINKTVRLIMDKYLPAISTAKGFLRKCPPESAIREAITNSLLHKDYSRGVPVRVMVSPSQIVVQNVGAAPEGWTEETLAEAHTPHFRNPVLAATARLLGITPGWGDGTKKMIADCESAGAQPPRFSFDAEGTEVSFPLPESKRSANAAKAAQHAQRSAATHAEGFQAPGTQSSRLTFAERSVAAAHRIDLTQTDEHVLQILTTNGRATAQRISQVLGVSERTVRRSFKKLRDHGFIERIGSDKAGFWSVID